MSMDGKVNESCVNGKSWKKEKKIIIKAGKNNIVLKITLIGQGPCVPIIIPCLKKH